MRARKRTRNTEVELNITAFLNLMVVLIPFLLLNAVFAQVSTLQLNLPAASDTPPEEQEEKPLVLEVVIFSDRYVVVNRSSGPLKIIPNAADDTHDSKALKTFLKLIKEQYQDVSDITLLAEADTEYELLVQTMDAVRYYNEIVNGIELKRNLFPDIGIGNAPEDQRKTSQSPATAGGDA